MTTGIQQPEVFDAAVKRVELEHELRRSVIAHIEPPPEESASEWCVRDLPDGSCPFWIPPGQASAPGPFNFAGREYARIIVDFFSTPGLSDLAACFGSQLGKTMSLVAGLYAKMAREACAAIWAMPNEKLARKFSNKRLRPFAEHSAALRDLIPRGAKRHEWSALNLRLGVSLLDLVGSNSPANLASVPVGIAIADEIDKFADESDSEADALNLLEQRTKDFQDPKRAKTSTPTTVDGPIWQEFLKGNQCRYFVPCPNCQKLVVLAWSKNYTIFKLTGSEAFSVWDTEARIKNDRAGWEGCGWDLERVENSARYECPHCQGHIRDGHKTLMVRDGIWTPTNLRAPSSFLSLHLPSLYGSSPMTRVGQLAKMFLQQKHGLTGLKGFINGELAEPDEGQGTIVDRVEIISPSDAPPIADKKRRLLGADHQQVGAKLPWVSRDFFPGGHSRLVAFGFCETFDQLREVQLHLGDVDDDNVSIDSGYIATTVYEECLRFGKMMPIPHSLPEWFGWFPAKGRDEKTIWTNKKTGQRQLFGVVAAPMPRPRFRLPLLEFNGPHIKDILERLRTKKASTRWELCEGVEEQTAGGVTIYRGVNPEYFKHLDAEIKVNKFERGRMVSAWKKRSKDWPDHLRDCEVQLLAMAMRKGILSIDPPPQSVVAKTEQNPDGRTYIIK